MIFIRFLHHVTQKTMPNLNHPLDSAPFGIKTAQKSRFFILIYAESKGWFRFNIHQILFAE